MAYIYGIVPPDLGFYIVVQSMAEVGDCESFKALKDHNFGQKIHTAKYFVL